MKKNSNKDLKNYKHSGTRKNIPDVGLVTSATDSNISSQKYSFDPYLDPQLQWAGKVEKNDFEIDTVSLHVHERIDPKTLIEKLKHKVEENNNVQLNFFDNPSFETPLNKALQFYQHDQNWSNRLIAGDSLLVMNSLLIKEGMANKVQTIFMDPPYGINYRSNFQPFTNKNDHKDNDDMSIPPEPEMIRAFRDTWELKIHSYLSFLRNRALLCRELLNETGSMFFQINDTNLHHAKSILEEIFGSENFVAIIPFTKNGSPLESPNSIPSNIDFIVWFAKDISKMKFHKLWEKREINQRILADYKYIELEDGSRRPLKPEEKKDSSLIPKNAKLYAGIKLTKPGPGSKYSIDFKGRTFESGSRWWGSKKEDLEKLISLNRIDIFGNELQFVRYLEDFPYKELSTLWSDIGAPRDRFYVVQTNEEIIRRCILMTSNAGEIIFDPTCGGGTTAVASERLGRKWITCDTSRVAINLAKKRIMTEVYDYYKLLNPNEGLNGGLKYKIVNRLTSSMISSGNLEGKKVTIYLEPEVDKTLKRVTGPFTVEAVPSVRVKSLSDSNSYDLNNNLEDYINEISSTGIQTIHSKKINFINLERSKAFKHIHAIGQVNINDESKIAYLCFGPDYGPMEQTQIEEAFLNSEKLIMSVF